MSLYYLSKNQIRSQQNSGKTSRTKNKQLEKYSETHLVNWQHVSHMIVYENGILENQHFSKVKMSRRLLIGLPTKTRHPQIVKQCQKNAPCYNPESCLLF